MRLYFPLNEDEDKSGDKRCEGDSKEMAKAIEKASLAAEENLARIGDRRREREITKSVAS